ALSLKNGAIHIQTPVGLLIEEAPFAYQLQGKNSPNVNARYHLEGNVLRFDLGKYNPSQALIIDPVVVFSTYTGSTADNFGFTATYDFLGNGFAGGDVRGQGYPTSPGVVQFSYMGGSSGDDVLGDIPRDIGIMKLSPDGTTKLWATYLGGNRNEQPHSMVVDSKNNLLVMGSTSSQDFPGRHLGFQKDNKGETDIYVIKLTEDGTQILGMTYLGGTGRDGLNGRRPGGAAVKNTSPLHWNFGDEFRGEIIVDKNDFVYVASCTESGTGSGFPAINGFNGNFGGLQDGCVFKLSPLLNQLEWGAYVSGPNYETCFSLDIDSDGDLFVTGGTNSSTMNFGPLAWNPSYLGGIADGYVLKIQNDGKQVKGGTFIGTSSYDQCYFVKVDKYDNVYVTGQTAGSIAPFPSNVYHSASGGQFIYKLSQNLDSRLISMTYGDGNEKPQISPTAFMVDSCERIFVSGWGGEENDNSVGRPLGNGGNTLRMEVTADAFDKTTDGSDFYLAVFSKNLTKLVYGTFIGGGTNSIAGRLGEHVDGGTSRFDPKGIVYQSVCGGCGGPSTPDFPTTPGAYSRTNNSSNCNNALFKLDFENLNAPPVVQDTFITIMAFDTLTFNYVGEDGDEFDSVYLRFSGEAIDGVAFPKPYVLTNQAMVSGVHRVSSNFNWISNCDHVGLDTITIRVDIQDKGCPDIKSDSATIKIVVMPPPAPTPPDVICMTFLDKDRLKLTWSLGDSSGYLSHYILYRSVNGNDFVPIDTFFSNNQDASFSDASAFDHDQINYCYKMIGVNLCGTFGTESYTICSVDQHNQPIEGIEIFTTTVIDNKDIKTIWFQSEEPDFKGYSLYRKGNDPKSNYEFISLLENREDTVFIDTRVEVHKYSYCYALTVKDKCGNSSGTSDPGCSILLQGKSEPFQHRLLWNPYSEWQEGVQNYDLWRHDDRLIDTLLATGN
ncbi:MAG: SBBP repeat-containing protein, partial [Bacteroidota bacterium]|nr:SBBP repeat-containing protein [Bacteroidota bacterium]MDX5431356.1 SBBP repeat-containing protein [Bacteroidota bacterium]MDX5470086.1 SBBP repeat-containing protein [Bacteroidota bacterium]